MTDEPPEIRRDSCENHIILYDVLLFVITTSLIYLIFISHHVS